MEMRNNEPMVLGGILDSDMRMDTLDGLSPHIRRIIRMSTDDFIIELFIRVDTMMRDVPKHPKAHLYPREVVTLALLFALKGVGPRALARRAPRWLRNTYRAGFPACRNAPACFGCLPPMLTGPRSFSRSQRPWA